MEHRRRISLLDENGSPLDQRIEAVLERLVPRFERQFPNVGDELVVTELFEEAGRRLAHRERRLGRIEKLHGYAWVTLRSVAASWMRRGANRLTGHILASDESEAVLATVPSSSGTAEQIEQQVLLDELLAHLTPDERLVCIWKKAGFSSHEIAQHRGCSIVAVDTLFSRAKDKVRRIVGVQKARVSPQSVAASTEHRTIELGSPAKATDTGKADGQRRTGS